MVETYYTFYSCIFGTCYNNFTLIYCAFLGSKPEYENWDEGQPNNYIRNGSEEDQDCTMLLNGKWNDNQCSKRQSFICQIRLLQL